MDADTKQAILRAGIAAPSADNSQPWLFHWEGDTLDLGIDPTRSGSVSDARYVLSDLAVGTCVENMLIQGRALGYDANPRLFATNDKLWPVRLAWTRADQADSTLAQAIAARHTDRRFPWHKPVTTRERKRLTAQAAQDPAQQLHWFDTKAARREALRVLVQAEALRFKSPRLHAELFSTVRFDAGWHATVKEGLPPAALAVEAPVRPLFQALGNPRLMSFARLLGATTLLGFRSSGLPARLSPDLCLLSTSGTERRHIINAGRALERVWLQAAHEGLAVQPFAAAGVLSLGFCDLEPAIEPKIADLQMAMNSLCPMAHGLIFLRLGHSRSPIRWRSGRRTGSSSAVSASFTI